MSPEIIKGEGYNRKSDYYSLGIILYEMLTGSPPHFSTNKEILYKRILDDPITYPKFLSNSAKNLISNLLLKNPNRRFGYKEIMQDEFMNNVDLQLICKKEIAPPIQINPRLNYFNAKDIFSSSYKFHNRKQGNRESVDEYLISKNLIFSNYSKNIKSIYGVNEKKILKNVIPYKLEVSNFEKFLGIVYSYEMAQKITISKKNQILNWKLNFEHSNKNSDKTERKNIEIGIIHNISKKDFLEMSAVGKEAKSFLIGKNNESLNIQKPYFEDHVDSPNQILLIHRENEPINDLLFLKSRTSKENLI